MQDNNEPMIIPLDAEEEVLKTIHVDDWMDTCDFRKVDKTENYSRFVLLLMRLPAWQQIAFKPWTQQYKLFCTYKGEKYRVTGASRLGDIWLTKNFSQEHGYELRVDIVHCSEWSDGNEN